MKKIFTVLFVLGLLTAGTASAQMGMMGSTGQNANAYAESDKDANISVALQEIYKSQNVSAREQVDCSKVTDLQLIKLGDAVMGYGITEAQHSAMENMMGGEEAAMTKQAHTNMGRAYLGCWSNYQSGPMNMSMMMGGSYVKPAQTVGTDAGYPGRGEGMMYGGNYGGWGMMGGYSGFGGLTMVLVWTLLILGIVALVKWLKKN